MLAKERFKSFLVPFYILISSYMDREYADNMKPLSCNSEILEKFAFDDLWWHQFWSERKKNDRSNFERAHWEISITVSRGLLGR